MSRFTAKSKSTASLLSVVVLASALLAPAAIAAPVSAGNSFEIPVATHNVGKQQTARHPLPFRRMSPGSSFQVPVDSMSGMAPWNRLSGGNAFDIPQEVGHSR